MKAENQTTEHNRTIKITGIPTGPGSLSEAKSGGLENDITEMEITVNYVRKSNDGRVVSLAIALDHIIIPRLIEAINNERRNTKPF